MGNGPGRRGTTLGAALFAVLALLTLAGFAVTRAARSGDDLVNSVELTPKVDIGGTSRISFNTTVDDDSVDVLIIDGEPGGDDAQVRALALGEELEAGAHVYTWDGLADDGDLAPSGLYALRVILNEEGRDILPPGRIEVTESLSPDPETQPLDDSDGSGDAVDPEGEGGG